MRSNHDNNFTFLRFVAASMVIVAHAFDLLNNPSIKDPLFRLIGRSMGWAGVGVFFAMSGYLIMKSLDRTPNLAQFARARALRIFPGLAACTLLTVAALSFFSTNTLTEYFSSPQVIKYILGNTSLLSIQFALPGVFEHNPMPGAVNGSLWTLPYEVMCYILAATASAIGLLTNSHRRAYALTTAFLVTIAIAAAHDHFPTSGLVARLYLLARLSSCFIIGMAYATYAPKFKLRFWHALILSAVAAATSKTPIYDITLSAALSTFVLWLAFVPSPLLRRISRWPDYSYGIYIYAFPIQQFLLMERPDISPVAHAAIAFFLVLIPAGLSWHFIEEPALKLKKQRRMTVPAEAIPTGVE